MKYRRTLNYRSFLNMFPAKYSYFYNVQCIRKHKNRARVMYGRFRPIDSEIYLVEEKK